MLPNSLVFNNIIDKLTIVTNITTNSTKCVEISYKFNVEG